MIDLLPIDLLDLVRQWLDDDDLKVATMVCELFRDIFYPNTLDAIISLLAKFLYHSKGS